jgi:hypothetical protein
LGEFAVDVVGRCDEAGIDAVLDLATAINTGNVLAR